jgi:hypothetical protein
LPLSESEIDISTRFAADEQLYRRVFPSEELSDGEVDPTRFNSVSFKKEVQSAPSVLRSRFASPEDALHKDCAEQKDVSGQFVYYVLVQDLPGEIASDDEKRYSVFPLHFPLPTCGAHSVISCCLVGDDSRSYTKPSPSARYDLRVKLAARMQKVRFTPVLAQAHPPTPDS